MSAVPRSPYLQTVRTSSSYLFHDFGPPQPSRRRRLAASLWSSVLDVAGMVLLSLALLTVLEVGVVLMRGAQ